MGAVAPVIGVVGAVAGMAQRNAEVSASRRQAQLQIEANKRAEAIQLLDIQRQRQQQQFVADIEKQQAIAGAQLSQMQLQMNEIAERVAIAQQLTSVNFDDAQAQLVAAAQQYEALRSTYEADQALAEDQLNRTQELGQVYEQLNQKNSQLQEALRQGDIRRAQLLSSTMLQDEENLGISEAVSAYDQQQQMQLESQLQTEVMADRAQAEYMEIDEDRANAFQALLTKINQSQKVSELAASNLLQADTASRANIAREGLADYRTSVSRIAQLGSQGIELAKQSSLLQTDINLGYGKDALDNASMGIRTNYGAQNAQINASVPRRNIFGGLLNIATAAVPLISMRLMNQNNRQSSTFRPSSVSVGLYKEPINQPTFSFAETAKSATAGLTTTNIKPIDFNLPL